MKPADIVNQADALCRELEAQGTAERRVIVEAAERQAAEIVEAANEKARRRVRAAIAQLRQDGARRIARAKAQIETERRVAEQARASDVLHDGCPELVLAVATRWHDPKARGVWIDALANEARKRLPPGDWTIEHSDEWTAEDEARLRAALPEDVTATLVLSDDFEAGLRITSGSATLDGTPERLMADPASNQARLLAALDRERGATGAQTEDAP